MIPSGKFVTEENCRENIERIITRLDRHTDTFNAVTDKLETIRVEQQSHLAYHKGIEKGIVNGVQDRRSTNAGRMFVLKLLALILTLLVVVAGAAWTVAAMATPAPGEIAKEIMRLQQGDGS